MLIGSAILALAAVLWLGGAFLLWLALGLARDLVEAVETAAHGYLAAKAEEKEKDALEAEKWRNHQEVMQQRAGGMSFGGQERVEVDGRNYEVGF